MDILIRSNFPRVEAAEACVKRIREANCPVIEIRLIPPERGGGDFRPSILPIINSVSPGSVGYGGGLFAPLVNMDTDRGGGEDLRSAEAVVEIVAKPYAEEQIRAIIVNAGGTHTTVY